MYDGRTGATLDASSVETYLPINDFTRIPFTAEELQTIKQSRGAGLSLLYFASKSVITPELNIASPYFMFPDEKKVQGSTSLFAALVRDLSQRGLVAIVQFVRTAAAMPRIAALIPQMETLSEEGIQLLPLGMNLVMLPFDDEISVKYSEVASEEGYQAATFPGKESADEATLAMINALTIDTAPYQTRSSTVSQADREKMCYYRDMSNPALQQFYSVLQAIALVENLPDEKQQREQDLIKPYFSLEPEDGRGEGDDSYQAMLRKRAVMRFKETVGLTDDAVALSEGPKVRFTSPFCSYHFRIVFACRDYSVFESRPFSAMIIRLTFFSGNVRQSKKRPAPAAAVEKKCTAGASEIKEWKALVASDKVSDDSYRRHL